jgi:hypothetical protein
MPVGIFFFIRLSAYDLLLQRQVGLHGCYVRTDENHTLCINNQPSPPGQTLGQASPAQASAGSKNYSCVSKIVSTIGTRHYCRFGNARLENTAFLF